MKAFLVSEPHRYRLVDVPTPVPSDDEVVLRVGGCGICGSDLDMLDGKRPMEVTRYPVIAGHEFSGQVVEAGRAVHEFRVGENVAVDTLMRCDHCKHCRLGWGAHCLGGFRQLGCTDAGGLAEFVAVPRRLLYKVSESLPLIHAALAEPASCAAHGVSKAKIKPGQSVVVVGMGAIGALAVQVARLYSPAHLIVVETDPRKLALADRLGASATVNAASANPVAAAVLDITDGHGADAVIECTGAVAPIQEAFSYVATKGRIVVIGVPSPPRFEIDYMKLLLKDATFRASNGYTTEIWLWVLDLLAHGILDAKTIITHQFSLDQLDQGFQLLKTRAECAVKVMIVP